MRGHVIKVTRARGVAYCRAYLAGTVTHHRGNSLWNEKKSIRITNLKLLETKPLSFSSVENINHKVPNKLNETEYCNRFSKSRIWKIVCRAVMKVAQILILKSRANVLRLYLWYVCKTSIAYVCATFILLKFCRLAKHSKIKILSG